MSSTPKRGSNSPPPENGGVLRIGYCKHPDVTSVLPLSPLLSITVDRKLHFSGKKLANLINPALLYWLTHSLMFVKPLLIRSYLGKTSTPIGTATRTRKWMIRGLSNIMASSSTSSEIEPVSGKSDSSGIGAAFTGSGEGMAGPVLDGGREKTRVYGKVPRLLYGTAWKKENTDELVYQALKAGFRGIDTAAQPRHYREDLVGKGIRRAIQDGILTREELYIQTKFTSPAGQDPANLPYDASLPIPEQIHASIASSLSNFTFSDTEAPYIDCLVLHSPYTNLSSTKLAWKTLSDYTSSPSKPIRTLGISNTDLFTLKHLISHMAIPPSIVQNRFYPATKFEVPMRELCREKGIVFQAFWTLTANPRLLGSDVVGEVASEILRRGLCADGDDGVGVAVYILVLGLEGVSVLSGTTKVERMVGDLRALGAVDGLVRGEWKGRWDGWMREFREAIGEGENSVG